MIEFKKSFHREYDDRFISLIIITFLLFNNCFQDYMYIFDNKIVLLSKEKFTQSGYWQCIKIKKINKRVKEAKIISRSKKHFRCNVGCIVSTIY